MFWNVEGEGWGENTDCDGTAGKETTLSDTLQYKMFCPSCLKEEKQNPFQMQGIKWC